MAKLLPLLLALLYANTAPAQSIRLEALDSTFSKPIGITARATDPSAVYVIEQAGRVQRYDAATQRKELWLDLSSVVTNRTTTGLLSMVFHPDPDSTFCYLNYIGAPATQGAMFTTYISRLTIDGDGHPIGASEVLLLAIDQYAQGHNGGDLLFGPQGYLYIPTGDNHHDHHAQDPQSLLGKVLRIDVDRREGDRNYAIPTDNPYADNESVLDEIWAMGIRNAWRNSFDRQTGDFYSGNVGAAIQEVNYIAADHTGPINFGWNCTEAGDATEEGSELFCADDATFDEARFRYSQEGEGMVGKTITGGYVYRGPDTALDGLYFCGDFFSGVVAAYPTVGEVTEPLVFTHPDLRNVSSFGEGADGSLYVADYGGAVFRLRGEASTAVRKAAAPRLLSAFPNPATTRVTLRLPATFGGRISGLVRNATGQQVYRFTLPQRPAELVQLDLPHFPAGVYYLTLTDGQQSGTARLLIQPRR